MPDGEILRGITGKKLSLEELFAKIFLDKIQWVGLVSLSDFAPAFFRRKRNFVKELSHGIE